MKTILIFLFLVLPLASHAQFDQNSDHTIKVTGKYVIKETPELIAVTITIHHQSGDFKNCSDSLLFLIQDLNDTFQMNGIDPSLIKLKDISINENYEYKNGENIKMGYIGIGRIEIEEKISLEFYRNLLHSITSFDNNISYTIKFKLSENQKDSLRSIAIEKAIDDANRKAKIIADKYNLKLVRIKNISFEYQDLWNSSQEIDNDLITEEWTDLQVMPVASREYSNPNFNPKEISLIKIVDIEWKVK